MKRRTLITGAALTTIAAVTRGVAQAQESESTRLVDVPPTATTTISVERRDDIVLIGLNRPFIDNRLDPPTRVRLARAFYQYEHDASLRAAVLFGHGEHFSRGIDVDASQAALVAGRTTLAGNDVLDPLGNSPPHRTKPVVVVA